MLSYSTLGFLGHDCGNSFNFWSVTGVPTPNTELWRVLHVMWCRELALAILAVIFNLFVNSMGFLNYHGNKSLACL